jgi:lipid-A-disaccharide synthase
MVYRVSPLTYMLGKPRVKVPRFAMVNLIAGEEVIPELVQDDFTAQNVVAHLQDMLLDRRTRDRMAKSLAEVKSHLRAPESTLGVVRHPADRAAEIILKMLA